MKAFRPLLPYIRYSFAYQIYPAKGKSKRTPDYIGEVKAWLTMERFSPFMKFSKYGTFEDWYNKQKEMGRENTDYVKSIVRKHNKYPKATLSQLNYKPRVDYGEKKLKEAIKTMIDEDTLEWELRSMCDNILVARAEGNQKRYNKWEKSVNIEEMAGVTKQEIDKLSEYDVLNKIKSLLYFENRGDDEFIDVQGNVRRGRIYTDEEIRKLIENLTPDKKKILKKKFG